MHSCTTPTLQGISTSLRKCHQPHRAAPFRQCLCRLCQYARTLAWRIPRPRRTHVTESKRTYDQFIWLDLARRRSYLNTQNFFSELNFGIIDKSLFAVATIAHRRLQWPDQTLLTQTGPARLDRFRIRSTSSPSSLLSSSSKKYLSER